MGNLTLETGLGSHNCDYIYNNLNQQIDRSSDNWKSHTASTYDKRGNLVLEEYGKNKKLTTAGAYTFDETSEKPAEDIHTSLSKCPPRQVSSIRILNKREEKYI